jgi:hypothetical protein
MGRRVFTQPHAYLADALLALGRAHVEQNRSTAAIPLLRESLLLRQTTGSRQPEVAQAQSLLGRALLATDGSATEAASLLTSALDYLNHNSTPGHAWLEETRAALGRAKRRAG